MIQAEYDKIVKDAEAAYQCPDVGLDDKLFLGLYLVAIHQGEQVQDLLNQMIPDNSIPPTGDDWEVVLTLNQDQKHFLLTLLVRDNSDSQERGELLRQLGHSGGTGVPFLRKLAEKIADDLMHDAGADQEARRLVLELGDAPFVGSGWGKRALTDRILKHLTEGL